MKVWSRWTLDTALLNVSKVQKYKSTCVKLRDVGLLIES